jgi:hypothetical protein
MLLDAMLLSVANVCSRRSGNAIAILPEMRISLPSGISVKNSDSTYEILLGGSVDYGMIQYPKNRQNIGTEFILDTLLFIHSTT